MLGAGTVEDWSMKVKSGLIYTLIEGGCQGVAAFVCL